VVIIGGGIVGCACAYALANAGVQVHLVERGPLGAGASRAGMSHVVTWEEPEMHLALARASQKLYEEYNNTLSPEIEYRRTGSLAVVEQPEGLPAMAEMVGRLRRWGLECDLLDARDLHHLEPGLAPDLPGGAYFPGDGMVNPLAATQALAQAARRRGAVIETHSEVTGIELSPRGRGEPGDRSVQGVQTARGRIAARQVVIAAGAWSGALGRMAGVEIPIQPRKGTLVVTAPVPADLLHCQVILSAGYMESVKGDGSGGAGVAVAANIQQVKNGNLLLGSSRQFAGFDLRVEPEVVREVVRRCVRFVPGLAGVLAIRFWAGLRPYTPDLLPIIGPVSAVPGLYIAAGHEGIGITEGPVTGLLISQMITGQTTALPVESLSPDRFQILMKQEGGTG
jgi:sarcosine oxidase subunit beta